MIHASQSNHFFFGKLLLRHHKQQTNHLLMDGEVGHLEGKMGLALIKSVGTLTLGLFTLFGCNLLLLKPVHIPYLNRIY